MLKTNNKNGFCEISLKKRSEPYAQESLLVFAWSKLGRHMYLCVQLRFRLNFFIDDLRWLTLENLVKVKKETFFLRIMVSVL